MSNHDPELASLKQMTRKGVESKNNIQGGSVGEIKALESITVKSKSKPDPQKVKKNWTQDNNLAERVFGYHTS
jgi:hypothetical protein